jgi:hypothetical protein
VNSQDNNFVISPKCGNSEDGEIEELEINPKFKSVHMSKKSKSLSGDAAFEDFSRLNSQGPVSRQSLMAQKLVINSDQNIKLSNRKNSSNRIIKINALSPKSRLKTLSGNGSMRNVGSRHVEIDLSSEVKNKKRIFTENKKWSKKPSIQSYNMSSLMSSAVNQSDSGKHKLRSSEEEEEVKALKDKLKKNERRVQRIIQGRTN